MQFRLANLSNLFCFTGWFVLLLLPLYQQQQGMLKWEIGLVAGTYSLTAILVRLRLGAWIGRWGYRPFIVGGALGAALCTLSYPHLPCHWVPMALVRGLQGVAVSFYWTAGWARIVAAAPPDRVNQMSGWFGISGLVASALGPIVGEAVLRHYPFPMVFVVGGALGLIGAVMTCGLSELPRQAAPTAAFGTLLGRPELAAALMGSLVFGVANGTFNTFIAPYVSDCHLPGVGLMLGLYFSASIAVRLKVGRQADRVGPSRVIVPGLLLMATGTSMLGFLTPQGFLLLLLSGILIGAGHGLTYPALSTLTNLRAHKAAGASTSLFMAAGESGILLGATVSGWVAHEWGFAVTFLGVGLLTYLGCALFYRWEWASSTV